MVHGVGAVWELPKRRVPSAPGVGRFPNRPYTKRRMRNGKWETGHFVCPLAGFPFPVFRFRFDISFLDTRESGIQVGRWLPRAWIPAVRGNDEWGSFQFFGKAAGRTDGACRPTSGSAVDPRS